MLGTLRSDGWIESVVRGMTERRQHRGSWPARP